MNIDRCKTCLWYYKLERYEDRCLGADTSCHIVEEEACLEMYATFSELVSTQERESPDEVW